MTLQQAVVAAAHTIVTVGHGTLLVAWAGMAAAVSQRGEVHRNRRALAELQDMSAADLRDIGLTRGDLDEVSRLPYDQDPTEELTRIRMQRHGW